MTIVTAGIPVEQRGAQFFFIMACVMAVTVIAGFSLSAFMGRSSFSVPPVYHVHALVFGGFTLLYVAQNYLVVCGLIDQHRALGKFGAVLIVAMVPLAIMLTLTTLQLRGGPPIFAQAEFLFVNIFHIAGFAALAGWAIARRKDTDWHRRLMFGAMATVAAPGLARLLPLPLFVPYAFPVVVCAAMVFPVLGMIADKRILGRVHRAWWWTLALPAVALLAGELVANTQWAKDWTAAHVAGTPGAARPAEAFMPPGFEM